MGASSRRKGRAAEQAIVKLARQYGLKAERTWQTAQDPDPAKRACDVEINGEAFQVKVEAHGFGTVYRGLEGVHGFFLRCDRGEWLVVLKASDYLGLLRKQQEATP
ncbi:MAG: hypothetical protein ABSA41_17100 [Terriglobia bacterium]|jgi:hypothetical protein